MQFVQRKLYGSTGFNKVVSSVDLGNKAESQASLFNIEFDLRGAPMNTANDIANDRLLKYS